MGGATWAKGTWITLNSLIIAFNKLNKQKSLWDVEVTLITNSNKHKILNSATAFKAPPWQISIIRLTNESSLTFWSADFCELLLSARALGLDHKNKVYAFEVTTDCSPLSWSRNSKFWVVRKLGQGHVCHLNLVLQLFIFWTNLRSNLKVPNFLAGAVACMRCI